MQSICPLGAAFFPVALLPAQWADRNVTAAPAEFNGDYDA